MALAGLFGARRAGRSKARRPAVAWPFLCLFALAVCGVAFIIYVLWPRWPEAEVSPDAPALPITIAGVTFKIPPAAIRMAVQRRAGAQERVDLVFLWPSLAPPAPASKSGKPGKAPPPAPSERVFVTISGSAGTLAPAERLRTIYPRYVAADAEIGPDGLTIYPFREDSPYKGEDLVYDAAAPERFIMRCSRNTARSMAGVCLHEARVGEAEIIIRFPRDWLADWRAVAGSMERLLAQLRPPT
ncbi:MAG: hypothetical protein HY056_13325 [Proteobacteria bacterium]|nr:hypothetical protein [Pseudomonadota bacterium]